MANEIKEISTAEFDRLLEEQTPQYSKWSDLYMRRHGLKPCQDNPANKCHAYDLVVGKNRWEICTP